MKRLLFCCACLLALNACSRPADNAPAAGSMALHEVMLKKSGSAPDTTSAPAAAPAVPDTDVAAPNASGDGALVEHFTPPPAPHITVPRLAYSYHYGVESKAAQVAGLVARHEQACRAAGPTVCEVTGSSITQQGRSDIEGTLSMRAAPDWLTRFRGGLPGDAKSAGGRITRNQTETEDLSTTIVDTEASIRAQTTLRDRLQALLASRPGKLQELLEVEQALAQVQGEIDSAQSELAVMRQRVDTSEITIDYRSTGTLSEEGAWKPVAEAIKGSQGVMADVIGFLILALAGLLPLAVVGAGVWFAVRRLLKWRKARAKTPAVKTPK